MTRIETSLTRLLGIEVPLVQAPIGPCATPRLAAAVSNAGGLGTLSATWQPLEAVPSLVEATRALTDRPFAVNLVLEWDQHARLEACLEAGAPIVSFFWGDPAPYVEAAHGAGATVFHTVGSAEEARRVAGAGVDVVVAQGVESGGHVWGQTATMPLVPAVVDAVGDAPVVAAGGIADGRGLAAALALGASGAWIGTRFVASVESGADASYKERVVRSSAEDTLLTALFDAEWPAAKHRVLRTDAVRSWEEAGGPSEHRSGMLPMVGLTGDLEALAFYAGQSVELVGDVRPAGEIVRAVAREAAEILRRGPTLLVEPR